MCVVSYVGDYGREQRPGPWSNLPPFAPVKPWRPFPGKAVPVDVKPYNGPTREQFEEFLELLRAARKFDVATGQTDCPAEEKTGWIEGLAKHLGVPVEKVREALA